ncbi:hypothetical protein D3C78_1112580 [compost metagenome]
MSNQESMISACSGASISPVGGGMTSTRRSSTSITPMPLLALQATASVASMPMMCSISSLTRSGSAWGRSILLSTGITSRPCSMAV